VTTRTEHSGYLERLLAGQPALPPSPLSSLNALRAEAVDRVGVLTVPTVRDEDWRFTDLTPAHPADVSAGARTRAAHECGRCPLRSR
jgi:hypothetical protein